MKHYIDGKIIKNTPIAPYIFEMVLEAPPVATEGKPGQFIQLFTGDSQSLLARPISISSLDKEKGLITIGYRVVGSGTKIFSNLKQGHLLKMLGPLGNGFTLRCDKEKHALIGGGVGVFPLLELCKSLQGTTDVYVGFQEAAFYREEFLETATRVYVATDNGCYGFKGNVMELFADKHHHYDDIYACGPTKMLAAVSRYANEKGIPAQVSLEERMACGIGACLGCVVSVQRGGAIVKEKVCKDGPVFLSSEVIFK